MFGRLGVPLLAQPDLLGVRYHPAVDAVGSTETETWTFLINTCTFLRCDYRTGILWGEGDRAIVSRLTFFTTHVECQTVNESRYFAEIVNPTPKCTSSQTPPQQRVRAEKKCHQTGPDNRVSACNSGCPAPL